MVRSQKSSKVAGRVKAEPHARMDSGRMITPSPYQQLTSSTMQKKDDYENMQKLKEMKYGDVRRGLKSQPGQVYLDDQIYETCA